VCQHDIGTDGAGVYGVRGRNGGRCAAKATRDVYGLLILNDLEWYKADGEGRIPALRMGGKYGDGEEDDTLLFSRNWPMTESNKGRCFLDFIKR